MDDVLQLVESLPHPPAALKEKKWLPDLRTRTVQVIFYLPCILQSPSCFVSCVSNALIHQQHNIRVISKYYTRVRLAHFAELLLLEANGAEKVVRGCLFLLLDNIV